MVRCQVNELQTVLRETHHTIYIYLLIGQVHNLVEALKKTVLIADPSMVQRYSSLRYCISFSLLLCISHSLVE